jgi:tRNA (uracil-5-)-methyltransferase
MASQTDPITSATQTMTKKHSLHHTHPHISKRRKKPQEKELPPFWSLGTNEEVLLKDVKNLLSIKSGNEEATSATQSPPPLQEVLSLDVQELSSTGDGLALSKDSDRVYVVPFSVPGDRVKAKVYKHFSREKYSLTDLVEISDPSQDRDDTLIKCPYFASCSGCQLQMVPYEYQLRHKKQIIEKAYKSFSGLSPEAVPPIKETIGSPLQYGYRTKLTPHFDGPPGMRQAKRKGLQPRFDTVPPIGFMKKGSRTTLDIEDCPIGTEAVRRGMKRERLRISQEISSFKKGATLLLRENTKRAPKRPDQDENPHQKEDVADEEAVIEDRGDYLHIKTCITDSNAESTEFVDKFTFINPAGSFFQNNNSILPVFTSYIRDAISRDIKQGPPIKNLVDAYSGSGLFTITLSSLFERSIGIDIAAQSIASAQKNARLNNLTESQANFIAADAANIFKSIEFPADETVVVTDPPRKGCDESFLTQLLHYGPARIIYVSCNVHTQARDVGFLVRGLSKVNDASGEGKTSYCIESLCGFDFFPQTGHVESVAVLSRYNDLQSKVESSE